VAADYTRFAYQDSFLLRAYTYDTLYYLTTIIDGEERQLASLDGGVSSTINLDVLRFKIDEPIINVAGDSLTFRWHGNTSLIIRYLNIDNDNTGLNASITHMDLNSVVYSASTFVNPNNFTILFDYSLLPNVNSTSLFRVLVTKETPTGSEVLKRYFTINAKSGQMSAGFALIISIIMVIFGMTFTITRLSFSWFGGFVLIGALAFLSLAVSTWYIIFMQVIIVICLVYSFIILTVKNSATVA